MEHPNPRYSRCFALTLLTAWLESTGDYECTRIRRYGGVVTLHLFSGRRFIFLQSADLGTFSPRSSHAQQLGTVQLGEGDGKMMRFASVVTGLWGGERPVGQYDGIALGL
ncbi:hypothetical protein PoB_002248200 [Plakobranchus ocellatus]|uniref:Uncharacterized protein n=1 Tax=Plakobranchus ocellatus TaxID=259542 RepID=A0AAV3ZN66_9GAST|nr:hypothetical protein PoB_002248200 [Plakobranchus ocellatus]